MAFNNGRTISIGTVYWNFPRFNTFVSLFIMKKRE